MRQDGGSVPLVECGEDDHLDGQELVEWLFALEFVFGQVVPDDKAVEGDRDDNLRTGQPGGQPSVQLGG
jgi:hypothetical protein